MKPADNAIIRECLTILHRCTTDNPPSFIEYRDALSVLSEQLGPRAAQRIAAALLEKVS